MNVTRWVYDHSPLFWQNFMCTQAGRLRNRQRYDGLFEQRRVFFREAGRWTLAEAEAYQLEKLRECVSDAYENVPFFRRRFDEIGVKPRNVRTFADFSRIPPLSKDEVRQAGTDLISRQYNPKRLIQSHSGGSTGMPLTCYHDREALADVYASFWEYHRPGVNPGDPYAAFQGLELIPKRQRGGPYWRMNRAINQRLYSIFHMSEATIRSYIKDLDAFRPVYLAGYANSLYLLARLAQEAGILPQWSPKAVFSTSEQLFEHYRQTIESVFRTKVWDAYSQDETCGSISEYECGHYHYDRAYGYMEFMNLETNGPRRLAEIICTGFLNKAWPLLRYRPSDLVEYEDVEMCPKCGRAGPIIHEICGRTGDVLLTPSGRRFPHISLIVKGLHGVRQVQLVQEAVDAVTIRYVPSENFRQGLDEELMVHSFEKAVGETIRWSCRRMDEIPRTRSGKFMSIVSEMNKTSDPSTAREGA